MSGQWRGAACAYEYKVSAVVVKGSRTGYRCALDDSGCFFENRPAEQDAFFSWIRHEMETCQETGMREWRGQEVFFEVYGRRPGLIICGGGHVGLALARLARFTGMAVTVIEDRPLFAKQAESAGADRVICDSFARALQGIAGGDDTYVVIATRGHQYDRQCLEAVLDQPSAYLGMMGSRTRIALLKETLVENGISREALDRLHAPIGLSIGSETPEEIAVSIMGEIIQIKNERKGRVILPEEICRGLMEPEEKIMATIVMRHGSAPRRTGAKMLVFRDGRTAGTIGGGYAESAVIRQARKMLCEPAAEPFLLRIDLTDRQAGDEGMVCGGVQEIFLERAS